MRTKWTVIHGDEVYFRDTAHGFLSWSVALVVTAALLGSAATAMIGSPTAGTTDGNAGPAHETYFVNSLLRTDSTRPEAETTAAKSEVATIFAFSLKRGELSRSDKEYLDRLVIAQSGLDQNAADQRVADVFASAREATESARKALAHTLLWVFIALLIGAFSSSFAGTIGGRQRDNVVIF